MSTLIVVSFPDTYRAEEMLGALRRLHKDDVIKLEDVAVVVKDQAGNLSTPQSIGNIITEIRKTGSFSVLGILVGTLVGAPFLGGVLGGIGGYVWSKITKDDLSSEFIQQVRESLPPSSSAVFVLGKARDAEQALEELAFWIAQGTLLKTSLSDENETLLRERVAELEIEAAELLKPIEHKIERVRVIVNPAAGLERPILRPLNNVFRPAGVAWDVAITQQAGDFERYAQQAVADGVDAVVVYGGDGSVMEAATALSGSNVPLGIIPGGTGNIMSVELGIPYDITQAANIIISEASRVRSVDLGRVGDKYFILRVSAGLEADMVKNTSRDAKSRWGRFAYWQAMLSSQMTMTSYTLTLDGTPVQAEGFSMMVTNAGNIGLPGLPMLTDISVSDGLLDVVVLKSTGFLAYLANPAATVANEMVQHWQVREVTVATEQPAAVQADGELWDDTPFTATVVPSAARIIVPV